MCIKIWSSFSSNIIIIFDFAINVANFFALISLLDVNFNTKEKSTNNKEVKLVEWLLQAVSDFIENLDEMKETMRIFADKRVVLSDVNMSNIIYNKSFFLIDIDSSYIDYTHSKDIIYLSNMNKFYMDVVNTLISDMPEVLERNWEFRERERLLGQGFNEDYKEMLIFMKELLENYYNKEIVTINDFRKLTRR